MMRNKILIMASIVASIVIICVFFVTKSKANVLMEFALYPTGIYSSSYYLVLYDDATLKCYYGDRATNDLQADKFMHKIHKFAKTKLNEYEFTYLILLADELIASGYTESGSYCDDGYHVTFLYHGTAYTEIYEDSQPVIIRQLTGDFLRLAPMKIELGWW